MPPLAPVISTEDGFFIVARSSSLATGQASAATVATRCPIGEMAFDFATMVGFAGYRMSGLRQTTEADGTTATERLFINVVLPFGPAVYAAIMAATGHLLFEHVVAAAAVLVLRYASRLTKELLISVWPVLFVAIGYDLMRFVRPVFVTPDRIVGCDIRQFELALFGVSPNETLSDYFAVHHNALFDLYFAIPYFGFILFAVTYGLYLFFTDRARLRRFAWNLSVVYVIAFVVWLVFPVAPPWYVREHGCSIIADALPSAAGLLRVDRLLGIHYFQGFYAKSPDVFGAIPSLHCAYAMIGVATSWRVATWRTWPVHLLYVFTMFAASVYLGHHWVVDGLAGWLAVLIAALIVDGVARRAVRKPVPA